VRRAIAILLLGWAAPAAAGSYTWSALLDGGYSRSDVQARGISVTSPAWDFGGQLSLGAVPLRPDIFQLAASGTYRQSGSSNDTSSIDTRARSENWGYSISAGALQFLPLSFTGFASRSETDFSTSAETRLTGLSTTTSRGIGALFKMDRAPTLSARLQQSEFDNTGVGGVRSSGKNTGLSLSGSHRLENHEYSVGYDTNWSQGTYADANYRTHQATFQGQSRLTDNVGISLNQSYLLRKPEPGFSVETNPRFDDNLTSADLRWQASPDLAANAGYAYRRLVADFPDPLPTLESLGHSFHAGTSWTRTKELSLSADLSASFGLDRGTDAGTRHTSGEALSLGARYGTGSGETRWSVGGSASAGLSQAAGADYFGYGLGASAGLSTFLAGWSTAFNYDGNFASNLSGQIGFTLRNSLTASASTRSAGGVGYRAQIQVSDGRQRQKFLERSVDSSAQTATASASASWSVHYLDLTAGLSNAAAPALGGPSGGLGLPSSLNTVSRFAALTASTVLLRNLSLGGFARYASISAPGRPDTWEAALSARLAYAIGLVTLSLEDRYSVGAQGGPSLATNVVIVRIGRSFGGWF